MRLQEETKVTRVAPGGVYTGHVLNQKQQNAFIKPITGRSCGTEPHSHYSLSGTSHLHLTRHLSFHPLSICLCRLLFNSSIMLKFVGPKLHDKHEHLVKQIYICSHFPFNHLYFTILALAGGKKKKLGDCYALTLNYLHGSSNG